MGDLDLLRVSNSPVMANQTCHMKKQPASVPIEIMLEDASPLAARLDPDNMDG